MRTSSFIDDALARLRRRRRGFTIVELLVVIGIITILASLMFPVLVKALSQGDVVNCVQNLRQMGQVSVAYYKDFDFWMITCGYDKLSEFLENRPFAEPPVDIKMMNGLPDDDVPFWYEAMAGYINPAANRRNAKISYEKRTGQILNPADKTTTARKIREEVARMCMLYTCPSKKQSPLGYGYNYCAPFGESIIYPRARYLADYHTNGPPANPSACPKDIEFAGEFCWPAAVAQADSNNDNFTANMVNYPCYPGGQPAPVQILWYAQSVHFGAITNPGGQIAICDTGLITNDPVLDSDLQPTGERAASAKEWLEHVSGRSAIHDKGYTRFPICDWYYKDTSKYRAWKFNYEAHTYDPYGEELSEFNLSWRPIPRHNGKVVSLFFDGNVKAVDIMDIVGAEWGDRRCLFDNRPARRPPSYKFQYPYPYTFVDGRSMPKNPLPVR